MASVARVIKFLLTNKGAVAVVGAQNYPLLQRTAMREWQDRFTDVVPWDYMKMQRPIILKKPTQNDKRVILQNGSQAYFLHFNNPEVLRGIDADIIHFEEACLLPDKESFDELIRRLSGRKGPIRQLILTTNPEATGGWISEAFKLKQKPKADGSVDPIIDPCDCQYCQLCLNKKQEKYEYVDVEGNPCTSIGSVCPNCGEAKENECPGKQIFYRVIRTGTIDNIHTPQDLVGTMMKSMDAKSAAIFVSGQLDVDLRESFVYRAFTMANNVYDSERGIDKSLPLFWSLDFNYDPQCSVICQEVEEDGEFHVSVLDEIVLWNSLPEHAAQEFCRRFADYKHSEFPVYVYGDPAGLYGTGDGLVPSYYEKIRTVLIKEGFKVKIMMKKPDMSEKDPRKREKVKIPVAERIEAVNAMLCSAEDPPRVRLKINEKCRNLIRSLSELGFTLDGKNINKQVDKNAGKSSNKEKAHVMTHPTDALGYYIYKRFPVIKNKQGVIFFQIPGESVTEFSRGKMITKGRTDEDLPEWLRQKKEARQKRRDERKKNRERKNNSLKGWLDENGLWGNNLF